MTVSYATALADSEKKPVWLLEFPDHGSQRYISSRTYQNTSSAATPGLIINDVLSTELDPTTGELEFGEVECLLVDEDGGVATFLGTNDTSMRAASATLKYGFDDVTEANFQSISLLVDTWERVPQGFKVRLWSALGFLDKPLFEDFEDDNFTLKEDLGTNTTTTLTVKGDLESASWRSSGYLLLSDQQTSEAELVEYSDYSVVAQDQTQVTISNRRKFSVGAVGKHWTADRTSVMQAWAYKSDPVSLFLRFATTTSAGTNGTWDEGDGDGLGNMVPVDILDHASMVSTQDARLPKDEGGTLLNGIYIGTEPIDSLLEMFRQEFLAVGLVFGLTTAGKLTLRRTTDLSTSPTIITGKVMLDRISTWERGYERAVNNLRWSYGYNPGTDKFHTSLEKEYATSQTRYGKTKILRVESRGIRGRVGAGFGFPDLEWDAFMTKKAAMHALEHGNPSPDVVVEGFLELQDTDVGTLVQLTHPGLFDLDSGAMGVTNGLFYVTALERDPERGRVRLRLRQRLLVTRPFYIAPDSMTTTYTNATAAEKQFGFIGPDAGNFGDGEPPYDTGI